MIDSRQNSTLPSVVMPCVVATPKRVDLDSSLVEQGLLPGDEMANPLFLCHWKSSLLPLAVSPPFFRQLVALNSIYTSSVVVARSGNAVVDCVTAVGGVHKNTVHHGCEVLPYIPEDKVSLIFNPESPVTCHVPSGILCQNSRT